MPAKKIVPATMSLGKKGVEKTTSMFAQESEIGPDNSFLAFLSMSAFHHIIGDKQYLTKGRRTPTSFSMIERLQEPDQVAVPFSSQAGSYYSSHAARSMNQFNSSHNPD